MVVAQNTISQWLNGAPPGRPAQVFAVERALDLPPGALSGYLGYLPADLYRISIETAIAVDDTIDDTVRKGLLDMLTNLRGRGREGSNPPKSRFVEDRFRAASEPAPAWFRTLWSAPPDRWGDYGLRSFGRLTSNVLGSWMRGASATRAW